MDIEFVKKYLFNTEKIEYVHGKKPDVNCILCALRDNVEEVRSLELYRDESAIITINLYPFNPGHIMIYPSRHIEDITELTDEEAADIHRLTVKAIKIIREEFNPSGFNIGYNIGNGSGASIAHIHQHIVPRFNNEIGFIDVIGGARVFVVDPVSLMERLKSRFASI
ncbi:MAG: HIT domain-containing protein [Spirochaetia bacterium]|jgi:ATP adenylyltransferase|nr:HIT domain-containing protein [Spirochaetia bacterium]